MKNSAFDSRKEDIEWSEKDTAFIDATINKKNEAIKTSFKQIKEEHESLPY